MRKMIIAAVAAVALGVSSVAAMAAHGGGGGGHFGGGFGGHVGGFGGHVGGFGGVHTGGLGMGGVGHGFTPHIGGLPSGGIVSAAPHTFSATGARTELGRAYAFRGHDHFHRRGFGFYGGPYVYGPSCYYDPLYTTWPNNNCYPGYNYDYN
jgi:hypothetical protein